MQRKKILAALFVAVLSLGTVAGTATAADARDTSWGCGGHC